MVFAQTRMGQLRPKRRNVANRQLLSNLSQTQMSPSGQTRQARPSLSFTSKVSRDPRALRPGFSFFKKIIRKILKQGLSYNFKFNNYYFVERGGTCPPPPVGGCLLRINSEQKARNDFVFNFLYPWGGFGGQEWKIVILHFLGPPSANWRRRRR